MALSVLVLLPLAGAAGVYGLRARTRFEAARRLALGIALGTFVAALSAWGTLDTAAAGVQLVERRPWITAMGVSYYVGVDGIALAVVTLMAWMTVLAVFVAWRMGARAPAGLVAAVLVLEAAAILTVVARDLFLFFASAEVLLLATFVVIGRWGREHRVHAASRFLFVQLTASSLMLTTIVWLAWRHQIATGVWSYAFDDLATLELPIGVQGWIWTALAFALAVRLPVFPFHVWLPDVLVQAPVPGAVLVGGVVIPVGGYTMLRLVVPLLPAVPVDFAFWIAVGASVGIVYTSVAAFAQTDLRRIGSMLIVSHLCVVVLAGSASTPAASRGALVHLLVVALWSGAWVLVVGMLGQRRHTTHIAEFGGLWRVMPGLSAMFACTALAALVVPGTAAYVGVSRVLLGLASDSALVDGRLFGTFLAVSGAIWSVGLVRVVYRVIGGAVTRDRNRGLRDLTSGEWLVVAPLVIVALGVGIWPGPLLSLVQSTSPDSWLSAMVAAGGGR